MSKKLRSVALPIVASVVGYSLGGPIGAAGGAALASGANNYSQTHNVGSALKTGALSGAGSYVGGNIGGAIGGASPTVAGGLEAALGPDLGSFIGQNLGSAALASIPSIAGSYVGSSLATSFGGSKNTSPSGEGAAAAFKPSQQAEMATPFSLQGLGSLTPDQMSTNIATKGVYGGGEGPDENSYYLNLLNRRLVDPQGNVGDVSKINPIENSYLSQLGLGGYSNAQSLLEAISKYKA